MNGNLNNAVAEVTVIGAGIVGLSTALWCARAGLAVEVLDPLPPGHNASFGNGGMISVDAYAPMAMPGMMTNVPRWLLDPLGPLCVRPAYLPTLLPWLARWIASSGIEQVGRSAQLLNRLHRPALRLYEEMLGRETFDTLIRRDGSLQVWESDTPSRTEAVRRQIRRDLDVDVREISGDECRELVPGLTKGVKRGLHFPRNGHTISPARLTEAIARLLGEANVRITHERVMTVLPAEDGNRIWTNLGERRVRKIVICAGAWSKQLVAPLGARLPLETERGYHLLVESDLKLPMPVLHQEKGFGLTPMLEGIRLGGTVELAGIEAKPNPERSRMLERLAKGVFPEMSARPLRAWMGYRPSIPDSVPVIGRLPGFNDILIATGHGHYGMIGAPATGRMIRDLLLDTPSEIAVDGYSIRRFN